VVVFGGALTGGSSLDVSHRPASRYAKSCCAKSHGFVCLR
jgi:hypothetical protein